MESLAAVLASGDGRRFDRALFRAAARHPSAVVRRQVALAMGRIGNSQALPTLLELVSDPDSVVRKEAVFSLGLLGDSQSLPRLREIAIAGTGNHSGVSAEAACAIARIGGPEAGRAIGDLLNRWVGQATTSEVAGAVERALAESWRLGEHAPVALVSQFAESNSRAVRWAAIYSLARLQVPAAASVLLRGIADRDPRVRSIAVRALTAEYADSAGVEQPALASRVEPLVNDPDPKVRINALRALGTYEDASVSVVADRTGDTEPNVRVQALSTLGSLHGPEAIEALTAWLDGGMLATRREALLSLARVAGEGSIDAIREWIASPDWRIRHIAAQALGSVGRGGLRHLYRLLRDPDHRVVAAALAGVLRSDTTHADSVALDMLERDDPVIRTTALRHLAAHPHPSYVAALLDAYDRAQSDRVSEPRLAIVSALGALEEGRGGPRMSVSARFLARFPQSGDYVVRRAAETLFPAAAARWGSWRPVRTGRAIADYRDVAREIVLPAARGVYRPAVIIETDLGNLTVDLLPTEAPLSVQAFLRLVDRRYFDGSAWHRVVPNFIVQDGDPRGDGWGTPGFTLRDEVSRQSYVRGTVGLARSDRDTAGSQFFITLSRQPQLEGEYTVMGRLRSDSAVLDRIIFGVRIRRIRRQ